MSHAANAALLLGLLATVTDSAAAQATHRTNRGYVFCTTLASLQAQSRLVSSGDTEAWQRFLGDPRNQCAFTKGGLPVYVENARGIGVIRMRSEGETVWFYTYSEAVQLRGG
jgi:hypothetical protein